MHQMNLGQGGTAVGRYRLDVVPEFGGPRMLPQEMFPALTSERFAAILLMLPSDSFDTASGELVTSVHGWLIRGPDGLVMLLDTCSGNGKNRPNFPIFHRLNTDWMQRLDALGVRPEQVTHVVNSHLHHDHVGWNTTLDGNIWRPTFPKARHIMPKLEAEAGSAIFPAWNGEAFDDSVSPILAAGLAELVEPPHEIAPDLRLLPAPGHSPGMMILEVSDGLGGGTLIGGDPMHHVLQVFAPELNTRFCQAPDQAATTRRALLDRCAEEGFALGAIHFFTPRLLRVRRDGAGFALA